MRFIIVSFCAASATMLLRHRSDLLPAIAAVCAVIASEWLAPGPWTIAVAAVAAALVAGFRYQVPEPVRPAAPEPLE